MEFQIPTFLRSLGLTPIAKHLPMLYDCTRYTRCPDPALNARYANESIVFFLPTRHTYGFHDVSDKGADKAIEAFARLVKEDAALRARLILVEKGEQVDRSRAMIRDLDIGSYVDWVPHLSKELMRHYYSMPNVVVLDQFQNEQTIEPTLHAAMRRLGARGSIFAESMCMGVPLISMVGSEWIQRFASRPLVWDACTVEEIVSAMRGAASIAPSEREARADSNRAWAWKHLHWEPLVDNYIDHFQDLIARRKAA
jgi:glycosyltransferase involved in cell wall biosynthesis